MKLTPSPEHNRTLLVSPLLQTYRAAPKEMMIDINYHTEKEGNSSCVKAIALDNQIIPEIVRRFNSHEKLVEACRMAAEWLDRSIRIDDKEQAQDLRAAIALAEEGK